MSKHTYEAWHEAGLFDLGVGNVVVCRKKASGDVTAAVFLVDVFCLGAKDAFLARFPESQQESTLRKIFRDETPEALSPACAKHLVEGAVAYGHSFGLPPHPDYQPTARLLNGIDASGCETTFTFGKDGKPFYCQGPYDSPAFVERVMTALAKHAGEGNYHYLQSISAPPDLA